MQPPPDPLALSVDVARGVIENGGETYRAEELLLRTARACGVTDADGFVIPTGIIASGSVPDEPRGGEAGTRATERARVRHIDHRTVNLGAISEVEELVRALEDRRVDAAAFEARLRTATAARPLDPGTRVVAAAFISGAFALLFGGSPTDFALAMVVGPIVAGLARGLDRLGIPPYFANMGGAALIVALATAGVAYFPGAGLEPLTAGPLMLLVPGLAITNSVRDTIEGDLVSGLARGIEAFLLAAALAVGAGFSLKAADILASWAR